MMAAAAAHLNYVAAIIGLIGWGLYFRTLFAGHVRTMPVNWLATAIIALTASVTTAELSSIPHAALYLVNTVCALTVVSKSLRNLERLSWADAVLIALGLLMFACAFGWPQYAALLVSAYYVVNYLSMGLRVLRGRGVEHPAGWFAWACGATVLAVALRGHGGYSELVPMTNIIVWSWMGCIASYRRWLGSRAAAPGTVQDAALRFSVERDEEQFGHVADTPAARPTQQLTGEALIDAVRLAEEIGTTRAERDARGPRRQPGHGPGVIEWRLEDALRTPRGHRAHLRAPAMAPGNPRTMNAGSKWWQGSYSLQRRPQPLQGRPRSAAPATAWSAASDR